MCQLIRSRSRISAEFPDETVSCGHGFPYNCECEIAIVKPPSIIDPLMLKIHSYERGSRRRKAFTRSLGRFDVHEMTSECYTSTPAPESSPSKSIARHTVTYVARVKT
jgi:hypothetical protein